MRYSRFSILSLPIYGHRRVFSDVFVLAAVFTAGLSAQDFETPPALRTADLLEPVWLRSVLHEVSPDVVTESGLDRFTIRTSLGIDTVYGGELLKKRVREIHAAAALDEKGLAGAAVKGVVSEGVDTAKTVVGAAKKPVRTLLNIPKGIGAIAKRTVGSVEDKVKAGGNYTGGPLRDWFQISEDKLALAAKLGVDPYTDYEPLQQQLSRLAGTSAVSGVGLRLIVPGDGIIAAAEAGEAARSLNDVYHTAPTQLYQENLKMLAGLGVSKDRAMSFLGSPVYSPADQSLMVRTVSAMGAVTGVADYLDAAESVDDRTHSYYFRRSTELLRQHHDRGHVVVGLANFAGYPAGITQEKRFVLPLCIDRGYWTEQASSLADAIRQAQEKAGCSGTDLIVTGLLSPRAQAELKKRGIGILSATVP